MKAHFATGSLAHTNGWERPGVNLKSTVAKKMDGNVVLALLTDFYVESCTLVFKSVFCNHTLNEIHLLYH